jgi:hypothetical protein
MSPPRVAVTSATVKSRPLAVNVKIVTGHLDIEFLGFLCLKTNDVSQDYKLLVHDSHAALPI